MKNIFKKAIFFILLVPSLAYSEPSDNIISAGLQPQLSMDTKGNLRIVFGRADSIFCSTSTDAGAMFTKPVFVGHIAGMHLGNTRGPQIASSAGFSVITAIDKAGNIHFYQLDHSGKKWIYKGLINDIESSAPEGLMSITADSEDNFYAVWLDIRQDKMNNICFSRLSGKQGKWMKNILIYISPDKHVCECCKPNIAVNGANVAVMFRNWLNGSRDIYLKTSEDGGITFNEPEKLGIDTWKLNGCPMDGGGITIDNNNMIHTSWQRAGIIYYCKPNESEVEMIKGRACSITMAKTNNKNIVISMQDGGNVKIIGLDDKKEIIVGKGNFLRSIVLPDGKLLCVWEQDKIIKFRKINLPASKSASPVKLAAYN